MHDQLTPINVPLLTDLGCAKQPTKLPANFGVRNLNCTNVHQASADGFTEEIMCLKPREQNEPARPTNKERVTRDGFPPNQWERSELKGERNKKLPRELKSTED
jgi:hypothetical protein